MSEAAWWRHLRGDPSRFLLDDADPGAVWLTLAELLDRPEDSPAIRRARARAAVDGPAAAVLDGQEEGGWWGSPYAYGSRWGGTAWRLIAAAALGADPEDPRVIRGVEVLLRTVHPEAGGFATGRNRPASTCFTAELCAALVRFGFSHDARVREAVVWLASRPAVGGGWSCPELRHLIDGGCPVASVAVLRFVAELRKHERARLARLCERASGWLLDHGLFLAGAAPRGWRRYTHPCLGRTDLLDALFALARTGAVFDAAIGAGLRQVLAEQGDDGLWRQRQQAPYGEAVGEPSRWITLKTLVALARWGEELVEEGS